MSVFLYIKTMCGKKYSVIFCIIYAWLVVYIVQGFVIKKPVVPTKVVDGTTYGTIENICQPALEISTPSVKNKTVHLKGTAIGISQKDMLMEVVQNTMYSLCPYGQFCRIAPPNVSSDAELCCTDCSCNETCTEEENKVCCFPKTDPPEKVTATQMECLTATFNQSSLPNSVRLPRYNMVTDCPPMNFKSLEESEIMVQSCKDNTLIQSLRPVFSKATKLIYKNKFCAQCNGETRFISWTPYLICTGESIQVEISKGFLSSNCYIRFKYPGDLLDIQFHRCCLPTFSFVPNDLSLDRNTIIQLCEHSIYAPYSYINEVVEEIFVNIYCAMCSSSFHTNEMPSCTQNIEELGAMDTYLGILDINLFDDERGSKVIETKKPNMEACRMLDSGEQSCRELFCKAGQVYNLAGQCVYVSLHWIFEIVHVLLKLSLGEDFIDCTFYDVLESEDWAAHLESDWLTSETIYSSKAWMSLCNCTRRLVRKCDPFIVVVYRTKYNRQNNQTFPEFLVSVREIISQPLIFKINGSSVRLTCELLNVNSVKDDFLWYLRNNPFYVLSYMTISVPNFSFQITKLFYCEQISLHELEYDTYTIKYGRENYMFIYSREHGKIFLPTEYTLHKRVDGSVFPRVCVTDTLFQQVTKANAGCQNFGKFKYIVVIIFAIITCFHSI